jgi:hypothetical protein
MVTNLALPRREWQKRKKESKRIGSLTEIYFIKG